jgi:hypothetical protein
MRRLTTRWSGPGNLGLEQVRFAMWAIDGVGVTTTPGRSARSR